MSAFTIDILTKLRLLDDPLCYNSGTALDCICVTWTTKKEGEKLEAAMPSEHLPISTASPLLQCLPALSPTRPPLSGTLAR